MFTHKIVTRYIDSLFVKLAKQHNLKSGDFTPDQQMRLDKIIAKLNDLINEWHSQNS